MTTIDGLGLRSSYLSKSLTGLRSQLDNLQQQLATGKKSNTYAGLGVDTSFAMGLRSQISSIDAFKDTITNVNVRLNLSSTVLDRLSKIASDTKSAANTTNITVNNDGQTVGQGQAKNAFEEMIQLLNSRSGDRYIFSGRTTDTPPTASSDDILNGVGGKAGLKQLIAERNKADLGASGLGRVVVSQPTGTSVQIAEDAAGSPFGFKLNAITSGLTGGTVTGPTGSPPTASIDLASNPKEGETVKFSFNLPDGTVESIELKATTQVPTPAGSFAIGADPTATAANLQAALTDGLSTAAKTSLTAASAVAASNNFFDSPPQRVSGSPPETATSLVAGTATDTVSWYTGETGTDSARGTATAKIDGAISVQYGARANEQALRNQLQTIATYAAVSTTPTDPNATALMQELNQRISTNLSPQPGQQRIEDMQSDLAAAQTAMKAATDRQTQSKSVAQTMLDSIEGISDEEVATKIIALQTALEASYKTTSTLFQTSLLKYI